MHRTIDAIVDKHGQIKLLEPVQLNESQRLLVTVLEQDDEETVAGYPVTMLLAAPALREYWDRPEEDEAWKDFQKKDE